MTDKILEFIHRHFPIDCRWLTGNCYYFAKILEARFPEGEIYYDVIWGHFLFKLDETFYDWTGKATMVQKPIKWSTFREEYDKNQYENIVKNCIL